MGYGDIAIANPNRLKLVLRNAHPHVSVTITTVKIIFFLCFPALLQFCFHPVKMNAALALYSWSASGLFYLFPVLKSLSFLQCKTILAQVLDRSVIQSFAKCSMCLLSSRIKVTVKQMVNLTWITVVNTRFYHLDGQLSPKWV